ncbi:SMC5-SMC6 complex localization factor protein 2 [Pelodytes ibericus]
MKPRSLNSSPSGGLQTDALDLPSSGASESQNKKATPAKRRQKKPAQAPSRSPIMEAFLRNGRPESHPTVSSFPPRCPKCRKSLLYPKVVIEKLRFPLSQHVDLGIKKDKRKWTDVSDVTQSSGKGTSILTLVPEHSESSQGCIALQEEPLSQLKTCTLPLNSAASTLQGAPGVQQKTGKMQQIFCSGRANSGSDEDISLVDGTSKRLILTAIDSDQSSDMSGASSGRQSNGHLEDCVSKLSNALNVSPAKQGTSEQPAPNTPAMNSLCQQQMEEFEGKGGGEDVVMASSPDNWKAGLDSSAEDSSLVSFSEMSLGSSCSSGSTRKRRRKRRGNVKSHSTYLSSDEDETLPTLKEIMALATKPLPDTPVKLSLNLSQLSSSPSPAKMAMTINPSSYVNSLDRLVKEKVESERLAEMEKQLNADLGRGMWASQLANTDTSDEGELADEHKEFLKKYYVVSNAIPDEYPGEEIFQLSASGKIFNHITLDLTRSGSHAQSEEENLIFSTAPENQLMLATQGYLGILYRLRKCPVVLMKWLFQMLSVHPLCTVSAQIFNTLMEISCNCLASSSKAEGKLWTPTLLDVATVFANMGADFQTLFPLSHVQPSFTRLDLISAVPAAPLPEEHKLAGPQPVFNGALEIRIIHVIKYLSFCSTFQPASYDDGELLMLIVMLANMHLDKSLRHVPLVDLHGLVKTLLDNIRDWQTKMPELCLVIAQLSHHHHNSVRLVQLIPASSVRGRQVRRQLCLTCVSKHLDENCTAVPTDYGQQMMFLCQCLVHMKPSAMVKKMQNNPENGLKSELKLDEEAYYLTFSLLNLISDASVSDENPSDERKYLLKLCTALERHVKSDIREGARYFYRTKVKDLVARIYGKWQELLHYSRPNQGKLYDYWEPVCENLASSNQ